MPKRRHDESQRESKEERWLRKFKRYEQKLMACDVNNEEHPEFDLEYVDPELVETECTLGNGENILPVVGTDTSDATTTSAARGASPPPAPPPAPAPLAPDADLSVPTPPPPAPEVASDFDPNLLRELGDVDPDPVEYGEELQADVAARLQKILQNGLKKEIKEELLKKYPFPKNTPLAKAPTLNPEIGAMLVETCKLRDKRLTAKQDQLGKALTAVGKALSGLLNKNPDIPDIIRTMNDASKILADSHFAETDTRRSVILPLVDKSLSEPFKERKRDNFLFGEKLGELVKDSRGLKKTGQLMASTSTLNVKGPGPSSSSRPRQQRSGQTYAQRAGGPRAAGTTYPYQYPYPYRRRAAAAPPPARRQPAPPPPPPPARRTAAPPPPAQRTATGRTT